MNTAQGSFLEFEHAGWTDAELCASYDALMSTVTMQCIGALLDAAGVRAGVRMLDVATGAGYVTAAAAARGAEATGLDFSATQVELARKRYPRLQFTEGSADALPFEAGTFDAVVSSFGMPHFPDPDAAMRDAFRVLRPGGRYAFSVWDAPDKAVGFGAVYAAVKAHGSMDVGLPVGPNFFLFSDSGRCVEALVNAGFASPTVVSVPQVWRVPDTATVVRTIMRATVRASATLRAQAPGARRAIEAAIETAIGAYARDGYFEVPMPAVVASALKP